MHSLIPVFLRKFLHKRDPQRPRGRRSAAFRERGAASVLVALMIPVLFAAAALALDFGKLVYERQVLATAMDASALAGSFALPDAAAARTAALKYASINAPEATPTISFWCVVGSTGTSKTVVSGQVPTVCDPGTTAGAQCNTSICAIPCTPLAGRTCNTMTVSDEKEVSFSFAPVIGIKTGNTGAVSATACKGGCGAQSPNPMDVVLMADRTSSMSVPDRNAMIAGIKNTLQTMTTDQQYVAMGTIHRSDPSPVPGTCVTKASGSATDGPWIPLQFSNNYTKTPSAAGATPPLNSESPLIRGLSCLPTSGGHGTYLASPMKAAARYVLDPSNTAGLPARPGEVRKGIIFETDGQPNEKTIPGGSTSLATAGDLGSSNSGTACSNLLQVARNAKDQGVLIVTVAFGDATWATCGTRNVRDVLAEAASANNRIPSTANTCTGTDIAAENNDGDFFFCAVNGAELGPIFAAAINAISPNTQLMRIPD